MGKRIGKLLFIAALLVLAGWLLWGNSALEVTEYDLTYAQLPEAFEGFRIAQISDLHNARFGENNETLLARLRQEAPDIIVITGDLIDSRRTDVALALEFVREAVTIAPCYYVTGNHEARVQEFAELEAGLIQAGVTVLRGQSVLLERNGQRLQLIGMDDLSFYEGGSEEEKISLMRDQLEQMDADGFDILLQHRPDLFPSLADSGVELILSGHAHGGQIRLPLIGGILAPNQGFFPEFDEGVFGDSDCYMVVSRGLGNSLFPLRVNNRPEIVIITLSAE